MNATKPTVADAYGDEIADRLARWAIDALVAPPEKIATGTTRISTSLVARGRAKRAPRWASGRLQRQKAGGKGRRTGWFVWNEDETRCYLIVKPRYDSGTPKDYVVVTALRRVD
jgi:hypothetical protein